MMRRYMNAVSTLTEAAAAKPTPAQRFVQTIQAGPRCKHCTFEVEGPRTVLLTWIEGGGGLVPYLTQIADQLRVKLTLMVEVYDTSYGGKLVRYYEKNGFETKSSDFEDDFDFMNMPHNDEMQGQVYMERKPAKAQTLGEGAAGMPSALYHATLKAAIPVIEQHGLQPQQGDSWQGDRLIFATDDKHRRKLVAVMLHKIAKAQGTTMNKITAEDVLRDGAVAVITDTHLFQRSQGRGRPIAHIEVGDYYADQPVPVSRFLSQDEMTQFLGSQFRIWTKLVARGEA